MLALQIKNKKIEYAFKVRFNADKDQLIAFIEESLKKSEMLTDEDFSFNRLDPLQNYYKLKKGDRTEENLSNPFENVADTIAFSKKLRENSYR